MENPKILIICALIIAVIAGLASLLSTKHPAPAAEAACAALHATTTDWDDPRYRLLCARNGGGR